jgi:hypothetical protein
MVAVGCLPGVELLVSATLNGWYAPSKAKYAYETDSEQVPCGKVEKNKEERVQQCVKLLGGKRLVEVVG